MDKLITRSTAINLHIRMWYDMREKLGDCPNPEERVGYKRYWCREHGFEDVKNDCFLCEHIDQLGRMIGEELSCAWCPVMWPTADGRCYFKDYKKGSDGYYFSEPYYLEAPISEILHLPTWSLHAKSEECLGKENKEE